MSLAPINPVITPPKKGGGAFGSILGGGLGALGAIAAAPLTGGASLTYLPAAAGVGMTAGGLIGNEIDPAQGGTQSQALPTMAPKKTALQYMMKMPEVQMATMGNAKNLLKVSDNPQAAQYIGLIDSAQEKLRAQLGNNSSIKIPV